MADKSLNRTELVAAVASESGQSQAAVSGVVDDQSAVEGHRSVVSRRDAETQRGWVLRLTQRR